MPTAGPDPALKHVAGPAPSDIKTTAAGLQRLEKTEADPGNLSVRLKSRGVPDASGSRDRGTSRQPEEPVRARVTKTLTRCPEVGPPA